MFRTTISWSLALALALSTLPAMAQLSSQQLAHNKQAVMGGNGQAGLLDRAHMQSVMRPRAQRFRARVSTRGGNLVHKLRGQAVTNRLADTKARLSRAFLRRDSINRVFTAERYVGRYQNRANMPVTIRHYSETRRARYEQSPMSQLQGSKVKVISAEPVGTRIYADPQTPLYVTHQVKSMAPNTARVRVFSLTRTPTETVGHGMRIERRNAFSSSVTMPVKVPRRMR